jgi:hypothetical protein
MAAAATVGAAATAAAAAASLPSASAAVSAPAPRPVPELAAMPARADQAGWCKAVAAYKPDIGEGRCRSLKLSAGDGRSVQGVPLWLADIVPATVPPRLKVLVLGGMHADEGASVSLVFDWIARSAQGTDARVHWRMAPLVNPDGFARKPATRVNARGVDLNRNFATHEWAQRAQKYWVDMTRRDPRRYPGPAALSEPESQWVHRQIESFKPNLIVSVHAPYGVLDFDGPPPPPDRLGSLFLDQVGVYPGSLGNYGGMVRGVPVVTIELKHSTEVPTREAAAMWEDLQGWIERRLLNVAGTSHTESATKTSR